MNNYVLAISIVLYLTLNTYVGLYQWVPFLFVCLYIYFVDFAERNKRTELEGEKNELKSEINQLNEEINQLKEEINQLKNEIDVKEYKYEKLKKKHEALQNKYNKVDIVQAKIAMKTAENDLAKLKDKVAGLSKEYELKQKELEDEIEPLRSLLELKEDKIIKLINNDKVFLSKRISEKSIKEFFEPFHRWFGHLTFIPTFSRDDGKKHVIWQNIEKQLNDAWNLDKKYQLKLKEKVSELNILREKLAEKATNE